ncbi:MAG: MarR family winged helix-turn-helix transcriptional regulator [Roseovarius sp.]|nr:MarR family winged helix-turn-helix transcriptional regulator [Roseovarius sp.]
MSTKLTRMSPRAGYELLESRSLSLLFGMDTFQARVIDQLVESLRGQGFSDVKRSQVSFLAALDCDANHAANIARNLRISRQAVHKAVRELEAIGWLETAPNPDLQNQKTIHFTNEGERMMSLARRFFFELDALIVAEVGDEGMDFVQRLLNFAPDLE